MANGKKTFSRAQLPGCMCKTFSLAVGRSPFNELTVASQVENMEIVFFWSNTKILLLKRSGKPFADSYQPQYAFLTLVAKGEIKVFCSECLVAKTFIIKNDHTKQLCVFIDDACG